MVIRPGRPAIDPDPLGLDGNGRDGRGRDGNGRDGNGRDGNGRDGSGPDGRTTRAPGPLPRPLGSDAAGLGAGRGRGSADPGALDPGALDPDALDPDTLDTEALMFPPPVTDAGPEWPEAAEWPGSGEAAPRGADHAGPNAPYDEDHFQPPVPPPAPRLAPATKWALSSIALGVVFLLAPSIAGVSRGTTRDVLGVLLVLGGVGTLVARMADRPPTESDDGDDGAVI
jgi:hypothetical protein